MAHGLVAQARVHGSPLARSVAVRRLASICQRRSSTKDVSLKKAVKNLAAGVSKMSEEQARNLKAGMGL